MANKVYCKTELYLQHEVFYDIVSELKNELRKKNKKGKELPITYQSFLLICNAFINGEKTVVIESKEEDKKSQEIESQEEQESMFIKDIDEYLKNEKE
jgi:hypothetical protein